MKPDKLKLFLDELYDKYCIPEEVKTDPVSVVRKFKKQEDIEIAAFIASTLAFGQVSQIVKSLENLFSLTGKSLFEFVRSFDKKNYAIPKSFCHRWVKSNDISNLFFVLGKKINKNSSLGAYFSEHYKKTGSVEKLLVKLSAEALEFSGLQGREKNNFGRLFFPSPEKGSACKRLNLFLRWMVRRNYPDFGLWRTIQQNELIIPLDVHVANAGIRLGLTKRSSRDWKMASEITESLRRIDSNDPLKYDFALHRWGKSKAF
ncbi:MAG: TIGR02757 family protein [Planctomycetota bacterium]